MKRISKSKKVATILGAGLLMLTACAPDSQTRGGAAQPAPIERSTDDGAAPNTNAASNANEANVPAAPGAPAQPSAASTSRSTLLSPLPTPTARPEPQSEIEFSGTVEVIASDMWVVGGRTVAVTAATEIKPGLTVGTLAKVHAAPQADGTLWAREIEPAANDGNGNSNSNDDNGNDGNSNDDNGNGNSNDDNGNDGNSNDDNGNDGNSNDDNGNSNDN